MGGPCGQKDIGLIRENSRKISVIPNLTSRETADVRSSASAGARLPETDFRNRPVPPASKAPDLAETQEPRFAAAAGELDTEPFKELPPAPMAPAGG
jgi:hypothetical protein